MLAVTREELTAHLKNKYLHSLRMFFYVIFHSKISVLNNIYLILWHHSLPAPLALTMLRNSVVSITWYTESIVLLGNNRESTIIHDSMAYAHV